MGSCRIGSADASCLRSTRGPSGHGQWCWFPCLPASLPNGCTEMNHRVKAHLFQSFQRGCLHRCECSCVDSGIIVITPSHSLTVHWTRCMSQALALTATVCSQGTRPPLVHGEWVPCLGAHGVNAQLAETQCVCLQDSHYRAFLLEGASSSALIRLRWKMQ